MFPILTRVAACTVSTSSLTTEEEAVIHATSPGLPEEVTVGPHNYTYAINPHKFNELATEGDKWNGKPRVDCVNGRHHLQKLLWVYCPGLTGEKGNDRENTLASKQPSRVACFSEDLEC